MGGTGYPRARHRLITGAVAPQETARCLFVPAMVLSGLINTRIKEGKTDADISIAFSPFHVEEQAIVGKPSKILTLSSKQGSPNIKLVSNEVSFGGRLAANMGLGQRWVVWVRQISAPGGARRWGRQISGAFAALNLLTTILLLPAGRYPSSSSLFYWQYLWYQFISDVFSAGFVTNNWDQKCM